MKTIETIARGVCVKSGRLLLCQTKGADVLYLPGGHVEFGESARCALEREIEEELGLSSTAGSMLGMVEHSFMQRGAPHCEWNAVFLLDVPGLDADDPVVAAEEHICFHWYAVDRLDMINLEPAILRQLLPRWLKRGGGNCWESAGEFAAGV